MRADAPRSVCDLSLRPHGEVFPSPADWRDQVLYEVMIDRFDDGRDRPPYDPQNAPTGRDPDEGIRFQGGNLRGITRRLDYIRALGATAIWITCPLKNRPEPNSYHGYGVQDFLRIDPRFGTTEDLRELVRQAHGRGMYVIMDIVMDHVGDVWAYAGGRDEVYRRGRRYRFGYWRGADGGRLRGEPGPDDALWPVELQRPDAFNRMGRMCHPDDARDAEITDGDFMSFKALALENPPVLDAVLRVFKYWIDATDIDGYRIDAFRHIRPESSSAFVHGIREYAASIGKTNFIQIGEAAAGNEVILRYVGSNTPLPKERGRSRFPMLDACLDFVLYDPLDQVLRRRRSARALRDRFDFLERYYRDYSLVGRSYVTFLENHDQVPKHWRRFLHGEDDPRLGVVGAAFLLTSLGIPCLYYGSEQGFDGGAPPDMPRLGGGDRYVRECMFGGKWGAFDTTGVHFFNPEHPIYRGIAAIARVREREPALRYGRQYFRQVSADGRRFAHPSRGRYTLAYSRVLADEEVLVALNLEPSPRQDHVLLEGGLIRAGATLVDLLDPSRRLRVEAGRRGRDTVRVPLEGRQVAILRVDTLL